MKNILIFGGSGGLGKQVTSYLNEVRDYKYNVIPLSSKDANVKSKLSCMGACAEYKPDIVINLTGVNFDRFIHKIKIEDWQEVTDLIQVNVHGSVNIAAACLPGMRERGYGRLIYISSVLSTKVVLGTGLYSSCKAFIDRLVKNISAENIGKGVTANSIQLGYFDGGLTYEVPDYEKIKESLPLKRWGTIEELCNTIEYIINTEYLTGTNIPLNGGI